MAIQRCRGLRSEVKAASSPAPTADSSNDGFDAATAHRLHVAESLDELLRGSRKRMAVALACTYDANVTFLVKSGILPSGVGLILPPSLASGSVRWAAANKKRI